MEDKNIDYQTPHLRKFLNISEEYKAFLWTPPKTGSMHATTIFSCLPFHFVETDEDRTEIFRYSSFPEHQHNFSLFRGHEDYTLICTARNPLYRLVSAYKYTNVHNEVSVEGFRKFFSLEYNKGRFKYYFMDLVNFPRIPDYFIRTEHMLDDYLAIPFVAESKLAKSGVLEELCGRKKNISRQVLDPKECYTEDMIDFIYGKYKWYFDKLGYKPELF